MSRRLCNCRCQRITSFPATHIKPFNGILRRVNLKLDCDGNKRTAYSLRHTYICMRLTEAADAYEIVKNCCTSVEMIEKFYAAHIKEHARRRRHQHGSAQAEARRQTGTESALGILAPLPGAWRPASPLGGRASWALGTPSFHSLNFAVVPLKRAARLTGRRPSLIEHTFYWCKHAYNQASH